MKLNKLKKELQDERLANTESHEKDLKIADLEQQLEEVRELADSLYDKLASHTIDYTDETLSPKKPPPPHPTTKDPTSFS